MALDHKRKEKLVVEACDGHWIRDERWDGETTATMGNELWLIEVKSEAMPRGLQALWSILDNAWAQLTERWEEHGRPGRRLVVYSPTGTGVDHSFAMWELDGLYAGVRITAPYRHWLMHYYRPRRGGDGELD